MWRTRDDHEGGGDWSSARRLVVLSFRGREILLTPGKYLVGRGANCHVVVDDRRISRRHARIDVSGVGATISDLGSVNGVCVNGDRISENAHPLHTGDVIELGREQLRIQIRQPTDDDLNAYPERSAADTLRGLESAPPSARAREDHSVPTRFSDEVELIFRVAEKGLEAGNPENAEGMVRAHLRGLLRDAEGERRAPAASYALATNFALRLAWETSHGEWFDYVIDMLRVRRVPCSDPLADRLLAVLWRVDRVDQERLAHYAKTLKSTPASMDGLRAVQRVEELRSEAVRRKWRSSPPD